MDTDTEKLVRDTVDQFVKDGFMFTAFDVTRTLRKAGNTIVHKEANKLIQTMFANGEMGQYVKDAVDVNAPVLPFLYYHPYGDISKYDQNWTNTNPTQDNMKTDMTSAPSSGNGGSSGYTPPSLNGNGGGGTSPFVTALINPSGQTGAQTSSPFAQALPIPNTIKLNPGEHEVTKDGRLQIPIDMVKAEGYAPNQTVYLIVDATATKIIVSGLQNHGSAKVYPTLVERDNRIRICRRVLKNISSGNRFKIEKDKATVVSQITVSVA